MDNKVKIVDEQETTPSTTRNSNFSYAYVSNIEDWSGKIDVDWMPLCKNLLASPLK